MRAGAVVVGMDLDGQRLPRVDELQEQWELTVVRRGVAEQFRTTGPRISVGRLRPANGPPTRTDGVAVVAEDPAFATGPAGAPDTSTPGGDRPRGRS